MVCSRMSVCEAQVVCAAHHLPPYPHRRADAPPHTAGNGKMTLRNYRYNTFLPRGSKK